jgi:pyridoxamine 5'-phosphate oxidase
MTLRLQELGNCPIASFQKWFEEAGSLPQPEAMTLATVDEHGQPEARLVLLKEVDQKGFVFFTNYTSNKAKALTANPKAALVFWWEPLQRQVRIQGDVEKVSAEESDAYFQSRNRNSRIGAWASEQSKEIPDREYLETRIAKFESEYNEDVPRPQHWGGYRVIPTRLEFWQEQPFRLHDRIIFTKHGEEWRKARLAP